MRFDDLSTSLASAYIMYRRPRITGVLVSTSVSQVLVLYASLWNAFLGLPEVTQERTDKGGPRPGPPGREMTW